MEKYCSHAVGRNHIDWGIMRAAKDTLSIFCAAVSMAGENAVKEWEYLNRIAFGDGRFIVNHHAPTIEYAALPEEFDGRIRNT